MSAYALLVLAVGLERLAEMVLTRRNARWSFERGGVESGRGHWPFMVVLHAGLLLACLVEVAALDRPFVPALGWTCVVVVVLAQTLRWSCILTLGHQWNARVIVVPGAERVARGPYRWLQHPNYVAVVAEGVALPLVHTAWLTAVAFTALNLPLLRTRLRAETRALAALRG